MGTVYCGPYADAIGYHEGYAAQILPGGGETSTWIADPTAFVGHQAACDCGWRGQHNYATTEEGEQRALEEWDHDHLRPLLDAEARKHTVRADHLLAFIRLLRESASLAVNERGETVLTERGRGVFDAVEQFEQLLDDLACTDHDRVAER